MKNEKLTHQEILDGLTVCFRQLMSVEVSDRNMPNLINRGRAAAAIVIAHHKEEVMEKKRKDALHLMKLAEGPTMKKLEPKKK